MCKKSWLDKLYENMRKHYTLYSFTANTLIALAIGGLALLGVLNTILTMKVLITWGAVFAIIYGVGKWLDQEVDDLDKLRKYECELYSNDTKDNASKTAGGSDSDPYDTSG